jgi:hemoglobin
MTRKLDLHTAAGGTATWRRLAENFYSRVDRDPVLRPLFPGKSHKCAIQAFTSFLTQFFDGPAEETQHRSWVSLGESHARFRIGERERAAWMKTMSAALDATELAEPHRAALWGLFEHASVHVVNAGGAGPHEPAPLDPQIASRWQDQLALDELVGAIRSGDAKRAIGLACAQRLQARFERSAVVEAGTLARMIAAGHPVLAAYVCGRIAARVELAHVRHAGFNLLHFAAAAANAELVTTLLRAGVDANVRSAGDRTPLYSLANGPGLWGAGKVVRILVDAGADVNAVDRVKRCTPLHMAARRGNVEIAEALLDLGAEIEARDSLGETPLRRAVNCNKPEVARLLVARGADVRSRGSKHLTAAEAARTAEMKRALQRRA